MDLIKEKKYIFKIQINFEDGPETIERIVFDLADKYCALLSKTSIKILNIKYGEN